MHDAHTQLLQEERPCRLVLTSRKQHALAARSSAKIAGVAAMQTHNVSERDLLLWRLL